MFMSLKGKMGMWLCSLCVDLSAEETTSTLLFKMGVFQLCFRSDG